MTTTYAYDAANRLESVDNGQTVASYEYDAAGQRTKKTVGEDVTNYYYNGLDLLYTKDGNGDTIEENVLEPDGSIISSKRSDENTYWYRQDVRGSVTNIVDGSDDVVKSYAYEAYGKTTGTGNFVNSFAYTGAVNDEETGLYYMNARYYDPGTGRFISQDSYRGGGEAFWNLYLYCDSDPVNGTDPTGYAVSVSFYPALAAGYGIYFGPKKQNQIFKRMPEGEGDCTNFVSQCLWAGYKGGYGLNPASAADRETARKRVAENYRQTSTWFGRNYKSSYDYGSPAFVRVKTLWSYAIDNTGKGPRATGYNNNNHYSSLNVNIKQGDILQVTNKANSKYYHSVIVVSSGSYPISTAFKNVYIAQHSSDWGWRKLGDLMDDSDIGNRLRLMRFKTTTFDE